MIDGERLAVVSVPIRGLFNLTGKIGEVVKAGDKFPSPSGDYLI